MISIPKKYWKPLITIKIINIATVSIPRDFILDDESDDVSVDEDDENFAFDNPENKPLDDELVLEFVSPKENSNIIFNHNENRFLSTNSNMKISNNFTSRILVDKEKENLTHSSINDQCSYININNNINICSPISVPS